MIGGTRETKDWEREMKWGKDWGPGWRYFTCEGCGVSFKESTRDATSPSSSVCAEHCGEVVRPFAFEFVWDMPLDSSKNLLESKTVVLCPL